MENQNIQDVQVVVNCIRERLYAEIAVKTGWGNQELKIAIERAIANALAGYIDALNEHHHR